MRLRAFNALFPDEAAARGWFERARWPHCPECLSCADEATGQRVHVHRVESFNGFMRRAVVGVWHQIGGKHIGRYASEASFRWNRKTEDVLDRMAHMVRTGEGRRLSYAFLTAKAP